LAYPDISLVQGRGLEFDPRPAAVPGCVLLKRAVEIPGKEPTVDHEWYYLDPAKGYALVRAELFNLPKRVPADPKAAAARDVIRLEEYHEAPQGFWYPGVIHFSMRPLLFRSQKAGEDRPPNSTLTMRYFFDFGVAIPDRLFAIKDASKSGK